MAAAEPKKTTTAKAPAKSTPPEPAPAPKAPSRTFTDHAVGYAADARALVEDIRTKVGELRDDVRAYYAEFGPEPHEARVHHGMSRLMSTVDDLERTLAGITTTAADVDSAAADATPPEA